MGPENPDNSVNPTECLHAFEDDTGVVQNTRRWMEFKVFEGTDLWGLPAPLFGPLDGQHVVGERSTEFELSEIGICCGVWTWCYLQVGILKKQ